MRAQEALECIAKEYESNQDSWRIIAGHDVAGLYTIYALHGDFFWTIKYPKHGMNGVAERGKLENDELIRSISDDPAGYGLRLMSRHLFELLLRNRAKPDTKAITAKQMLENAKTGQMMVVGPVLHAPVIKTIDAAQRELEAKLNRQLDDLTNGMYA